jgi:acetyltransferase-like isoleucine patch superfamily enzyme
MMNMMKVLKFLHSVRNKKLIVFGTGNASKNVCEFLPADIAYFVDNDISKWGNCFLNAQVVDPATIVKENKDEISILVVSMYFSDISKQLEQMGLVEGVNIWNGMKLFADLMQPGRPNWSYWQDQYERYRNSYDIAKSFTFNGEGILLYGKGNISLGEESYIGRYSSIEASEDCTVTIGRGCRISHFVKIYSCNAVADQDFSQLPLVLSRGDVTIGDYCWVGANVFIREGVKIGNNVVVGANSVVIRDIPDDAIIGGIPAKILKYKNSKERDGRDELS